MFFFLYKCIQDLVDFSLPPLWGIENKASLFDKYPPRNVHLALHNFVICVTSKEDTLLAIQSLNSNMAALWISAYSDSTSLPKILKAKRPDVVRAGQAGKRGAAAAELMRTLWDSDYSSIRVILVSELVKHFPLPENSSASEVIFNQHFKFSTPPTAEMNANEINIFSVPRVSRAKPSKKQVALKPESEILPSQSEQSSNQTKSATNTPTKLKSPAKKTKSVGSATVQKPEAVKSHFLFPVVVSNRKFLAKLRYAVIPTTASFKRTVQDIVAQLLKQEPGSPNAILVGKQLLPFAEDGSVDNSNIFIQPGVITLPFPPTEDRLNFLEVRWLESESSDGTVQVSEVINLEYINPLPPFVVLDAEDVFDCAPTSIFNRTFFESGYISLYTDCSAFGIEIAEHQAENKKRSAPPSNEVSAKTSKRTANDIRAALTTLISDALLPGEESKFIDSDGNWPLCKTVKCKKSGKFAVYADTAKKVPRYCFSCKSAEFQFVYYNNLKSWLTSKNMLQTYKIDTTDPEAKRIFGVAS